MKDNRHLAAIFFSDMVGYSAATHKNEDLALELLDEHRNLLRPLIAKHQGREVKTMGDGFLVEFGTARAATTCAIEAQQAHLERNKASPPDRQVWIRIGVHLGEVVTEGEDVFGDGVNIAARLMQIARPGRVCVSSPVMDQVRTHLDRWVTRIGRQRLKGISSDVFVFVIYPEFSKDEAPPTSAKFLAGLRRRKRKVAVGAGILALVAIAAGVGKAWLKGISLRPNPRIAVLPLQGLGLKSTESFIADGLTDEIISTLSRVKNIRVLSRNSSARFGPHGESILAKAAEMDLSGYVEGSVQKLGNHLRIHVALTDAKTQENTWAKDFEGTLDGAFATQKQVARDIAEQFFQIAKPKEEAGDLNELTNSQKPNEAAYIHYLKALQLSRSRTEAGLHDSLREFRAAAKIDPKFANTYGYISNIYTLLGFYGFMDPVEASRRGKEAAGMALTLDPNNPEALLWFAEDMAYTKFDWTKADEFYERSIAANPSWPQARQWYGEKLVYMGRFDESEQQLTRARDLDPLSSVVVTASALPDFFRGHYDRALETYRLAAELDPGSMLPHLWAGKAWLEKKEYAKALASFRKAEALSEHSSLLEALQAQAIFLLGDRAEAERRLKGLIERSRIEHVSHYSLAHLLIALGQIDRGFAELALAIRERDGRATSFAVDPLFASVRNDARFTLLLRQMGLGLPPPRHK